MSHLIALPGRYAHGCLYRGACLGRGIATGGWYVASDTYSIVSWQFVWNISRLIWGHPSPIVWSPGRGSRQLTLFG